MVENSSIPLHKAWLVNFNWPVPGFQSVGMIKNVGQQQAGSGREKVDGTGKISLPLSVGVLYQ